MAPTEVTVPVAEVLDVGLGVLVAAAGAVVAVIPFPLALPLPLALRPKKPPRPAPPPPPPAVAVAVDGVIVAFWPVASRPISVSSTLRLSRYEPSVIGRPCDVDEEA